MKDLEELDDLQSKVKQIRLVEKLGKQGYHYDIKERFEPTTNSIKAVSEDVTRTMMESCKENSKELVTFSALSNKLLGIKNDWGIIASYLLSPPSKITTPENTSQFILVKDSNSNRISDLLIHNTITVTLYDNFLIFRDTNKEFEIQGDLSEMITYENYKVDLAFLQDE